MGKRELVALLSLSIDCCLALPHDATVLSAVLIVLLPDHTHYFAFILARQRAGCFALIVFLMSCDLVLGDFSSRFRILVIVVFADHIHSLSD